MLETDNTNQVLDLIEDVISMIKKRDEAFLRTFGSVIKKRDEAIAILHDRVKKLENKTSL